MCGLRHEGPRCLSAPGPLTSYVVLGRFGVGTTSSLASVPGRQHPQPHWQGFPDWHPHPHPEPQPHAPIRVRFLISAGCSVGRSWVGSGVGTLGDSAMGSSRRRRACAHCMPAVSGASTAHSGSRAPRAESGARPGPSGRVPQAPSPPGTGVGWMSGWMSGWSSSACSPVTRNTTRLATATAWSANRS